MFTPIVIAAGAYRVRLLLPVTLPFKFTVPLLAGLVRTISDPKMLPDAVRFPPETTLKVPPAADVPPPIVMSTAVVTKTAVAAFAVRLLMLRVSGLLALPTLPVVEVRLSCGVFNNENAL